MFLRRNFTGADPALAKNAAPRGRGPTMTGLAPIGYNRSAAARPPVGARETDSPKQHEPTTRRVRQRLLLLLPRSDTQAGAFCRHGRDRAARLLRPRRPHGEGAAAAPS